MRLRVIWSVIFCSYVLIGLNACSDAANEATSNTRPVAVDDAVTTAEDLSVKVVNPVANDLDADGDSLYVESITNAQHGDVIQNDDGSFTYTPNKNFNGQDSFSYTVADGNGEQATGKVDITVIAVNDAPIAMADSLMLNEDSAGATITVVANDTDVDGDTLSVVLDSEDFVPTLNGELTYSEEEGVFTYTPNKNFFGRDSFKYVIADPEGAQASATVTIDVTPVSDMPVITSDAPISTFQDANYSYQVEIADPDGQDTFEYKIENGPIGMNISDTGLVTWIPNNAQVGSHQVLLKVTDADGLFVQQAFTVSVANVNDQPIADVGGPYKGLEGQAVMFNGSGSSDADGDALSYSWEFGDGNSGTGEKPQHAYTAVGKYVVSLVVSDNDIESAPSVTEIQIDPLSPNIVNQLVDQTVNEGSAATFSITVTGTSPFTYQWYRDGQAIDGATDATYTTAATTPDDDGTAFSVTVTNAAGSVSSVTAQLNVNIIPTIAVQPVDQYVNEGNTATFSVTAQGTGPLSYQWQRDGVDIPDTDSPTHTTPFTSLVDDQVNYTVVVTNVAGSISSDAAVLYVNGAPQISSSVPTKGTSGAPYAYQAIASDPNGDVLTYYLQNAPVGMSVDMDGLVSWTPSLDQQGDFTYTIIVNDEGDPALTDSQTATVNVVGDKYITDYQTSSVAMNGDTLIFGDIDRGYYYFYQRTGNTWTQQPAPRPSDYDPVLTASAGYAVAIDNDTAIIGTETDEEAYIFVRNGDSWAEQAILTASDGADSFIHQFGQAVSISGDFAVVSADRDDQLGSYAGAVYIFERSGNIWTETAKITASDGAENDHFGFAVALDGNRLVVSALADKGNGANSGVVYIFEYDGNAWNQTAELIASDGAANDRFGRDVALDGNTLAVGKAVDNFGLDISGAVYVFDFNGQAWVEQEKLISESGTNDRFGEHFAITGDTIVVGAAKDQQFDTESGAAYLFKRNGTAWDKTLLTASDQRKYHRYGIDVTTNGTSAIIMSSEGFPRGIYTYPITIP